MSTPTITTNTHHARLVHPVEYDALQRRVWILGQRCHHGATGAILATGGLAGALLGVARQRRTPHGGELIATVATATAGTLLMLHDWHDRSVWFQLGPGM